MAKHKAVWRDFITHIYQCITESEQYAKKIGQADNRGEVVVEMVRSCLHHYQGKL